MGSVVCLPKFRRPVLTERSRYRSIQWQLWMWMKKSHFSLSSPIWCLYSNRCLLAHTFCLFICLYVCGSQKDTIRSNASRSAFDPLHIFHPGSCLFVHGIKFIFFVDIRILSTALFRCWLLVFLSFFWPLSHSEVADRFVNMSEGWFSFVQFYREYYYFSSFCCLSRLGSTCSLGVRVSKRFLSKNFSFKTKFILAFIIVWLASHSLFRMNGVSSRRNDFEGLALTFDV